jgi:glycosyltransferase involved in cell wall biosynthesis
VRQDDLPLVSAVIPVYNGQRYLAEAIQSVLAQEHEALELIVIDDGSSDGSAAVAGRFSQVRYHYQPNGGIGAARNRGLELARGTFIAFLDADDVWMPQKLAVQLSAFATDPGLDIVSGHVEQFHSPELDQTVASKIHCPSEPLPGYAFGAMLVKRSVFLHVGPVSTSREKAECVDWCLRAKDLGLRIAMLPSVVLRRRLHDANHGLIHRQSLTDYAYSLKVSLDRRRAANLARFQDRGHVYLMHGVVDRPVADSFGDRNMLDREGFIRFLEKRVPRFGPLEDAVEAAADALTIDDTTGASFDAAVLARDLGHEVTLFLNPFNVETGTPYWFCLLDVILDRTARASCRFGGRDFTLSHLTGKRQFRAAVKSRACELPTEEARRAMISELADSIGVGDLQLPPSRLPLSRQAVEQLVAMGVRVENHGWTHGDPQSVAPELLWADIERGESWFRQHLALRCRAYAVPFGETLPPDGTPEHLVDMWYTATSRLPAGRIGTRTFNRSPLDRADILT